MAFEGTAESFAGAFGGASLGTLWVVIAAKNKLSGELKKVDRDISATAKSMQYFKIGAAAAAGAMAIFVASSIKSAAEFEGINKSFQNMTKTLSFDLLEALKKASHGVVTETELMKKANQAMLLGIKAEDLPQLLEGAATVAQATGRSISEAFDDITIGMARQSKLILDNLGIIVDIDKAYKDYAESIGKSSAALTENEKRIAFNNATLKGLQENVKKSGEFVETTQMKIQKLQVQFEDFKVAVGNVFLPAISDSIDYFEDLKLVIEDTGHSLDEFVQKDPMLNYLDQLNEKAKPAAEIFGRITNAFLSMGATELGNLGIGGVQDRAEQIRKEEESLKLMAEINKKTQESIDNFGKVQPEIDKTNEEYTEANAILEEYMKFKQEALDIDTEDWVAKNKAQLDMELYLESKKEELAGLKLTTQAIMDEAEVRMGNVTQINKETEALKKQAEYQSKYLAFANALAGKSGARGKEFEIAAVLASGKNYVVSDRTGEWSAGQAVGGRQFGGMINRTGMYRLHEGETVIPKSSNGGFNSVNITINAYDAYDVADKVSQIMASNIQKMGIAY